MADHKEILFLIAAKLKMAIPESQIEHLQSVIGESIREFLELTGHEPEGVVVSVCLPGESPEERLH